MPAILFSILHPQRQGTRPKPLGTAAWTQHPQREIKVYYQSLINKFDAALDTHHWIE